MVTYPVALTNCSNCSFVTAVASIQNPSTRTRWIGPASLEAIGISQLPPPSAAAPIANSPPGIQTIPSGPLPGGETLFATVRANSSPAENVALYIKRAATTRIAGTRIGEDFNRRKQR